MKKSLKNILIAAGIGLTGFTSSYSQSSNPVGKMNYTKKTGTVTVSADFNNDQLRDYIILGYDTGFDNTLNAYLFTLEPNGKFKKRNKPLATIQTTNTNRYGCSATAGDFNNDKYTDLLITVAVPDLDNPVKTYYYENNGDGTFTNKDKIEFKSIDNKF